MTKNILEDKDNWKISVGFATGNTALGNTDWFQITESIENGKLVPLVMDTLKGAYNCNPDICAHWFFYIIDGMGRHLSLPERALLRQRVSDIFGGIEY